METIKHSPLPWHQKPLSCNYKAGHAIFYSEEKNGIRTHRIDSKGEFSEENAKFIVEACNKHERAVGMIHDACKMLPKLTGDNLEQYIKTWVACAKSHFNQP